ncbi:hypothetical protein COY62_00645 [bacterium (Candidatus Howlettbacteria) CG_4_10_14_0_8_um_filter_40_9]|nr:MAG: hypothetical protein COY62_00645 [bacterium (Candidatus Howlettbacteria) CG_4_10_14_0_8_um_filter_40_9]
METTGNSGGSGSLKFSRNEHQSNIPTLEEIKYKLGKLYEEKMDTATGERAFNIDKEIKYYEELKAKAMEKRTSQGL